MTGFLATVLLATQINFFALDPRDDWSTKSTEHFRIHYLEEASDIADRVAKISEPIYDEMTEKFSWTPSDVIHVVLLTRDDVANGFSTPFPYNMVALNIAPPPAGSGLDEYDEWISLLFTHELTHTIHIDMVRGFNKLWRYTLGRTIIPPTSIPNSVQPQWLIEGIATDHESRYSSGGRGASSYVEMYFRTAAMEDALLPIERGTYWNDIYPYGSAAYWYGVRFHQYLREKYGEEKIYEFANLNSKWVLPSFFNFKTRKIFGKSFDRIWNEWRAEERRDQLNLMSRYQPRNFPSLLVNEEEKTTYLRGTPAYNDQRNEFYLVSGRRYDGTELSVVKFDELQNPSTLEKIEGPKPGGRLDYWGEDFLVYSKKSRPGVYRLTSDIYAMSTLSGQSYKLSKGLRLTEPTAFKDQVVAVRINNMRSQIVRLKKRFLIGHLNTAEEGEEDDQMSYLLSGYSEDLSDEEKEAHENSTSELKKMSNEQIELQLASIPTRDAVEAIEKFPGFSPAEDKDELEVLFEAKGFDHISHPSFSPDGKKLVFSISKENESRDLYVLDIESRRLERLTQDRFYELHPSFSADGQWIVFSSDRELGSTDQRVYNAYALHLESKRIQQLTDYWTGVYYPKLSNQHLVYGHYGHEGFRPAIMKVDLEQSSGSSLQKENIRKTPPPIVAKRGETPASEIQDSSYRMGDTLLPHFLIPFWFYTETDTAVGAITGSRDPLGYHEWQAFGYHFFTPNRPGGSISYINSQIPFVKLAISGGAFISNYGSIWLIAEGDGRTEDYYERTYRGQVSAAYSVFGGVLGGRLNAGHYAFYEDRRSLLPRPDNLIEDSTDFVDPTNALSGVLISPEEGQSLGFGTNLSWSMGGQYAPYSINPVNGTSTTLNVEYTPEFGSASDFHTLITSINTSGSIRLYKELSLAARAAAGMQWLDVLYQRTFRLGGSIGQSPFANSRRFSLRGLSEGAFRGEGVLSGSLELRFPLLSHFLGFGTAPIWIKNIHGALFVDAGQAFQKQDKNFLGFGVQDPSTAGIELGIFDPPNFGAKRFTMSVGGELRSNISLWYAIDYVFRLGYGRVWFLQGNDIFTADNAIDEVYVQVGPSF